MYKIFKLSYIFLFFYVKILYPKINKPMEIYMKKLLCLLLATCLVFTACGSKKTIGGELKVDSAEYQLQQPVDGNTVAEIKTSEGTIKVLLFPQYAPKAVENFTQLANSGYYDGQIFHRAIEDFIIQSGSPDGSTGGGMSIWGLEFQDEFSDLLHHYTGALAMANHGEDTNGSQFYFVTTPVGKMDDSNVGQMQEAGWRDAVINAYQQTGGLPQLDYRATVFGQIYEGLGVAMNISQVKTDENDKPKKDVTIESIKVYVLGQEQPAE